VNNDGVACDMGTCAGGSCCGSCVSGMDFCAPGDDSTGCGSGGRICDVCDVDHHCCAIAGNNQCVPLTMACP
jgi:hypothetical protein